MQKPSLQIYSWKHTEISNATIARSAAKVPTFLTTWCTTQTLTLAATAFDVPDNLPDEIKELTALIFTNFYMDKEEF